MAIQLDCGNMRLTAPFGYTDLDAAADCEMALDCCHDACVFMLLLQRREWVQLWLQEHVELPETKHKQQANILLRVMQLGPDLVVHIIKAAWKYDEVKSELKWLTQRLMQTPLPRTQWRVWPKCYTEAFTLLLQSSVRSTLPRDGGDHKVGCHCSKCAAWLDFSEACGGVDYLSRERTRKQAGWPGYWRQRLERPAPNPRAPDYWLHHQHDIMASVEAASLTLLHRLKQRYRQ